MSRLANGLHNAPVSRFLVIATPSASAMVAIWAKSAVTSAPLFPVTSLKQAVRLLTNNLHFVGTPSIVIGCALLFIFRVLERRWGSRKYAACIFILCALCSSAQVALEAAGGTALGCVPGLSLVFALSVSYFLSIPAYRPSRFLFLTLSDKAFTYAMLAQLASASLSSAALGIACGIVYHFGFSKISFSRNVGNWFRRFAFSSPGPVAFVGQAANQARGTRPTAGAAAASAGSPPSATPAPPSEESIISLMHMGFSRDEAVAALRRSNNDVNGAANFLLAQN